MKRLDPLRPLGLVAFVPLALVAVAGCDAGERRETAVLAQAVDRFHLADNAGKPAAVDALRAVPCSVAEVCRARDACLASAEATAKALRLKHEVEVGLSAVEKGTLAKESLEAQALPQKLDEAEALLREGFESLPKCDDPVAALKRKHHL